MLVLFLGKRGMQGWGGGLTGSGGLTNSDLQGEAEFAQKTRPEALLSFKFPQPKLPSNTLFRAQPDR